MVDDWLRKLKEIIFAFPARLLNRFLSPLAVTFIAFAAAIAASYLLWQQVYQWAFIIWVTSRVLDGFDGTMARLSGRQSALGGYLDLMCDVVIYALFPIAAAIADGGGQRILIALALLLAAYYVNITCWSVLAAILEKRTQADGKEKRQMTTVIMPRGIVEGFETAVIYSAFCVFPHVLWYLFIGTAILVMLSALIRVVWAVRNRLILEEGR